MDGSDAPAQIATTFLRLGTWDDEPAEPMVDRYDQLDDVLGTAATAFLGITLRCARCHDHKFEPFSQVDYYRMLAVFEPLEASSGWPHRADRPVGTEPSWLPITRDRQDGHGLGADRGADQAGIDRLLAGRPLEDGQTRRQADFLSPDAIKAFQPSHRSERGPAGPGAAVRRRARAAVGDRARRGEGRAQPLDDRIAAIKAARPAVPRAYIWSEDGPSAPSPTSSSAVTRPGRALPSSPACPPCWPQGSPILPTDGPSTAAGSGWRAG